MLYFYFNSVLCIFKISLDTSSLTHGSLRSVLSIFQACIVLPVICLLLISLWLENTPCMDSVLLNSLRFALWPGTWFMFVYVPWPLERILLLLGGGSLNVHQTLLVNGVAELFDVFAGALSFGTERWMGRLTPHLQLWICLFPL